jgi:hypothetical protein
MPIFCDAKWTLTGNKRLFIVLDVKKHFQNKYWREMNYEKLFLQKQAVCRWSNRFFNVIYFRVQQE